MANLNLKRTVTGSRHVAQGKGAWTRPTQVSPEELARRQALLYTKSGRLRRR